uniref:Uncharacterized protein n=1 Tax=Guillardia theta TaxID=55529 RepID=A0A7S4JMS8_GUITH
MVSGAATDQANVSLQELKDAEARIMALSIVSTAFFLAAGLLFWLNPNNNLRPSQGTDADNNGESSSENMVCIVPHRTYQQSVDLAPKDYLVITSWCLALFAYTFKQRKSFHDIYLAIFFTLLAFILIKSPKRRRKKGLGSTRLQRNPSWQGSDTSSKHSRSESEIQEDDELGRGSSSDLLASRLPWPGKDGSKNNLLRTESSVSSNEWKFVLDSFTQALDETKEDIGSKCSDVKWAYALFCTLVTKSKKGVNSLSIWVLKAKLEAASSGRDASLTEMLKTEEVQHEISDATIVFDFCQRWLHHLNWYLAGHERRTPSFGGSYRTGSGSRYWADVVKREIVKRALNDDMVCTKCIVSAYGNEGEREMISSYAEDKLQ